MASRYWPLPQGSHTSLLVALSIVITVGFCSIFAAGLWESRDRDREQARFAAANVVASVSSEIERNLELYGLSLEAVADGLKLPDIETIRPELRQKVLFDLAATAKHMGSIFVLDRDGKLVYDSRNLAPKSDDHAERDYFIIHRENLNAGLYVSVPFWRETDGYLIAISRVLTDATGAFSGAVVGTMRVSYFENMFNDLNLGAHDTITLVRENGSMIMRSPLGKDMVGRNVAGTPAFSRIVGYYPSGSFEQVGRIDGVERLFVFQRVAEYPLIVSYNLATADIFANWWRKAWQFGALILTLCAINFTLVVFLVRALKQRSEAQQRLAMMATTDSLTGLRNRRTLDRSLELEWRSAERGRAPLALLMIDADNFKNYNDQFGHQAGDTALSAIAHCIQDSLRREADLCARYGGEEFAVLLPGLTTAQASAYAEEIRAGVLALRDQQCGRPDSTPTISIGAASLTPRVGLEPRDLIKAADMALYEAKRNGRNRTICARPLVTIAAA